MAREKEPTYHLGTTSEIDVEMHGRTATIFWDDGPGWCVGIRKPGWYATCDETEEGAPIYFGSEPLPMEVLLFDLHEWMA